VLWCPSHNLFCLLRWINDIWYVGVSCIIMRRYKPNIINLSKKAKTYCPDTNTLKKYQLFDLKVKGQTEVTVEHDTPSHDYARYTYIPNIINIHFEDSRFNISLVTATSTRIQSEDVLHGAHVIDEM
jgi:hypothetical protein